MLGLVRLVGHQPQSLINTVFRLGRLKQISLGKKRTVNVFDGIRNSAKWDFVLARPDLIQLSVYWCFMLASGKRSLRTYCSQHKSFEMQFTGTAVEALIRSHIHGREGQSNAEQQQHRQISTQWIIPRVSHVSCRTPNLTSAQKVGTTLASEACVDLPENSSRSGLCSSRLSVLCSNDFGAENKQVKPVNEVHC